MLGRVTWKIVKRGSLKEDHFKEILGPQGVEEPKRGKVFHGFQYTGRDGEILKAWLHLYPGNIEDDVRAIYADMRVRKHGGIREVAVLTVGEYIVWHGLFIAASLCAQSGRALWDPPKRLSRFRTSPEFGKYMNRHRFEAIKASLLAAFVGTESELDAWGEIRPLIERFNENRRKTVLMSRIQVPDEAMSPLQPRTSATADLDHLSFVERKPKKLGTEVKCICDGISGIMRFLEIQEGKTSMATKRHRRNHGAATAQALRLIEGNHGWSFADPE